MNLEDRVYRPLKRVAFRKIDGQMVIIHPGDNKLVRLNETGTATWERLDGRTVKQIAEEIAGLFDVTVSQALDDVSGFLAYLEGRNFVESVEG